MPGHFFLILQDDCVSEGIPILSGAWANALCSILIAIVGGKWEKKKASAFFHMFCKETVQMDHLLVWSFRFLQPSSNPSGVGRARHTQTHTQTHPSAHSPPVWSTTGCYWLTCLNSASSKSHCNSSSSLPSWMTWQSFFPTYLTFPVITEICLSPFCLLPEKPCWHVFSHYTLGFIPLTP